MLEKVSEEKKGLFLLGFTEELIRNSKGAEIYKLREILRRKNLIGQEKEELKETIKEEVKLKLKKEILRSSELVREPYEKSILHSRPKTQKRKSLLTPRIKAPRKRKLGVPQSNLPQYLQNIKPVATSQEIELGKLNVLVNDPNVKIIECTGENEKIFVSGKMGKKPTGIILTKEEIDGVIDNFSKSAKMPKSEGLFKVAFGKLVLTAMVSSTISSTFIIKKIETPLPPRPVYRTG